MAATAENGSNGHGPAAEAKKLLTVTDILAVNDIVEEDVEVPEWGGAVRIRAFTKARQHQLREMSRDPRTGKLDEHKLEMQLFIHGVIEPKFEPVQATELEQKSAGAIDRILTRIMAISGMTEGAIREAEKSLPG